MASETNIAGLPLASVEEKAQPISSRRFDWIMVVVSIWWLGGLFIDGWAHSNIPQLETFFTPWHAVLYSGYLAVATTLIVRIIQNLQHMAASTSADGKAPPLVTLIRESLPGNRWLRAIPAGYGLSLLGVGVFLVSGIGDMTWHIIFGIERGTEALLSPTHLGLALGIGLSLSGPLRAAWRRQDGTGASTWRQLGPAILSLTFAYSLLTFFTEYANPLINPWPIADASGSASRGITTILLTTGIMMGLVLLVARRWRLPFGTWTFMFGVNGLLMAAFAPIEVIITVPTALLGGLAADLTYRLLQPSPEQLASLRLFAFLVPALFYLLYFINLALVAPELAMMRPTVFASGIVWTIPFWAGAPVIAGATGCLLSYVMIPPAMPAEKKED
jgi:hypothetical protein